MSQATNQHEAGSKHSLQTATRFMLFSCLAYSSILKMKATCSSETLADFQRTTRRYIPEDVTLSTKYFLLISYINNSFISAINK
jgi:hypothetical protein